MELDSLRCRLCREGTTEHDLGLNDKRALIHHVDNVHTDAQLYTWVAAGETSSHPTGFIKDQRHLSLQNLDVVFSQIEPLPSQRAVRTYPYKIVNGITMRKIPVLPDTIAANVETFRLVFWDAMDANITLDDINARMPASSKLNQSAYCMRLKRFRDEHGMRAFKQRMSGFQTPEIMLVENLTEMMLARNTVWDVNANGYIEQSRPKSLKPESPWNPIPLIAVTNQQRPSGSHRASETLNNAVMTVIYLNMLAVEKTGDSQADWSQVLTREEKEECGMAFKTERPKQGDTHLPLLQRRDYDHMHGKQLEQLLQYRGLDKKGLVAIKRQRLQEDDRRMTVATSHTPTIPVMSTPAYNNHVATDQSGVIEEILGQHGNFEGVAEKAHEEETFVQESGYEPQHAEKPYHQVSYPQNLGYHHVEERSRRIPYESTYDEFSYPLESSGTHIEGIEPPPYNSAKRGREAGNGDKEDMRASKRHRPLDSVNAEESAGNMASLGASSDGFIQQTEEQQEEEWEESLRQRLLEAIHRESPV